MIFTNRFAHGAVNGIAHVTEVSIDVIICKTQNTDAEHFNDLCSGFVIFLGIFGEMLTAVKFNNKPSGRAVKVGDEREDYRLPFELDRISSKKIIPKMVFVSRCVFAQFAGTLSKFSIRYSHWITQMILTERKWKCKFFFTPHPSARKKRAVLAEKCVRAATFPAGGEGSTCLFLCFKKYRRKAFPLVRGAGLRWRPLRSKSAD